MKYLPLIFLLSSCGFLEKSNDNLLIKTFQGQSIFATDSALVEDQKLHVIDNFTKDVENYITDLQVELYKVGDTKIRKCEFFSYPTEFLGVLDVIITDSGGITERAMWTHPRLITIRIEDKMESLYGHELVRYILYMCGHTNEAWTPSSYGWSGLVGDLWNVAETESLKYLD